MVGKEGRCRRQKLSQEEAQSQKEAESREEEGGIKEAPKEGGGAILSPVLHFVFLWPLC